MLCLGGCKQCLRSLFRRGQWRELKNLYVVRCAAPHPKLTPVDKALYAVDMIVSNGGSAGRAGSRDIRPQLAQRIPLHHWYRFRRAVNPPTRAWLSSSNSHLRKSCAAPGDYLAELCFGMEDRFAIRWKGRNY